MGKSQACNQCYCLKIQCLLVPGGGLWGPKETVQDEVQDVVQDVV